MKKISSRTTTLHKRVFPLIWFGFLAVFVTTAIANGAILEGHWEFLAMPVVMAAFGFFLMKKLAWDLMDEVFDCGDALVVKKDGEEERIPLSNIMNVNASTHMNPPRVTLRLVNAGRFGSEVTFSPPAKFSFNPFAKNPLIDELIVRVDRARLKRPH